MKEKGQRIGFMFIDWPRCDMFRPGACKHRPGNIAESRLSGLFADHYAQFAIVVVLVVIVAIVIELGAMLGP